MRVCTQAGKQSQPMWLEGAAGCAHRVGRVACTVQAARQCAGGGPHYAGHLQASCLHRLQEAAMARKRQEPAGQDQIICAVCVNSEEVSQQ